MTSPTTVARLFESHLIVPIDFDERPTDEPVVPVIPHARRVRREIHSQ
jgi:hypothetical protein